LEEEVRRAARELFRTEQSAEAWLGLRNERLGATPLELLEAGHGEEVLAELNFVKDKLGPQPPDSGVPRWLSELFRLGSRR
jgi:hypothetical protein